MRPWLAAIVVLSVIGSSASSQQPPEQPARPPPQQQPTFRTEANYVRVDAYPTADDVPVTDLTRDDFEILENGVVQKIEQFEQVTIRPAGPQQTRIEPNTIRESRAMAENSRARLFVVFLDTYHVDVTGSHNIRRPLVDALDRMIGPDDLVAVMTPRMSGTDITFARKTTHIEEFLTRHWDWGEQSDKIRRDQEDQEYESCYALPQERAIAEEMIARRHETLALDALRDVAIVLGGIREERKAIIAVTSGWVLFRPNSNLARPLSGRPVPGTPRIGIDPGTGKLTAKDPETAASPLQKCEADRVQLAQLDDEREFLQMLDQANRANASFYPVDPRGLVVFDTPITAPLPPAADAARLRQRLETLRTLASATDGLAMLNSNNLDAGLRRAVADLSSYYLLGYYSTGRLDGRFHPITVRVKRRGVQVRARRGYLAATADEVATSASRAAAPLSAAAAAEAAALQTALGSLAEFQREAPLRVHVASGWRPRPDGWPAAVFWIVGEIGAGVPTDRDIDVTLLSPSGSMVGRGSGQPTGRSALIAIAPSTADAGEYTVRVRADGAAGTGIVKIALPAAPDAGGAVFFRRGPTTGNREVPTADLRFRRSERIRVNLPTVDTRAVEARLLDRTGKALAIPMTAAVRDESDGSRWQSTELALAPLAPADYVIELTTPAAGAGKAGGAGGAGREDSGGQSHVARTLIAFRVIP